MTGTAKKTKRKTKNQFKKGHKKSVGFGRPKMSKEEKALAIQTRTEWKKILNRYLTLSKEELKEIKKDPKLPILDSMVITSLMNTDSEGTQSRIDWFLNHVLGKEIEESTLNLNANVDTTTTIDLSKLSKEELLNLEKIARKHEDEQD